ncbi:MAG: hypothetical protein JRH20_24060 [Deltaproteobacteria bacterium]|nr:hypothetical protein [Deltaproteobacteria bacterium]
MKRVLGAQLSGLQAQVAHWRENRESGGSRIPQELWDEAVTVARVEGICATAKALRFNYYDLKKRFEQSQGTAPAGDELSTVSDGGVEPSETGFVQLQMRPSDVPLEAPVVIELTGRGGDRMRIETRDGAGLDVVGMVRAFWSRAS